MEMPLQGNRDKTSIMKEAYGKRGIVGELKVSGWGNKGQRSVQTLKPSLQYSIHIIFLFSTPNSLDTRNYSVFFLAYMLMDI